MTSATATPQETPVAPGVAVRKVSVEAPWDWLAAGWRDIWEHPHISLGFGFIFCGLAVLLFFGLSLAGLQSLILALAGGFMIIGPIFAVGLYDLSRRVANDEAVTSRAVLLSGANAPGQLIFLGAILMFIYYVWIQIAFLLFMLFFGSAASFPPTSQFVATLLFEPQGLGLLITGTLVGAVLATLAFSISVVSVPLLTVRRMDAVSAIGVSIAAASRNFRPMALWAGLIGFIIAVGFLTCFVGLVFAFPLIGHATWHAFNDLVRLD
ncbi:MAG: DUF2189 domain-containing protein [Hyphomicrobiaceae bacterium]